MQWLGSAADVIGILGGIFAFFAWLQARRVNEKLRVEKQRQERKIRVVLCYGASELELPIEIRRAEFTRAELLGRLGMIPMKDKGRRFELTYLNSAEFLRRLNEISDGKDDSTFSIPCTKYEFEQFHIK